MDESLVRPRQQTCEHVPPRQLTLDIGDKVLADLDRHVMQAAPLAVNRNRIIRRIGHAVGLVVADHELLVAFQQRHEEMGETRIAIVKHTRVPGPRSPLKTGVKLCIAISAAGRPDLRLWSSSASIRSW